MTERTDSVIRLLVSLHHISDTAPGRTKVTCLQHSLQVAYHALNSGADSELVFVALVHDIARGVASPQHGEAAAWLFKDRLSQDRVQILATHGVFQHDLVHGVSTSEQYKDRRWYKDAKKLQLWEKDAFEPGVNPDLVYRFFPLIHQVLEGSSSSEQPV